MGDRQMDKTNLLSSVKRGNNTSDQILTQGKKNVSRKHQALGWQRDE